MMTSLLVGFYNRNDKAVENLNDYAEVFDEKDEVVALLEQTADIILKAKLKSKSYFLNKANLYSLVVAIATKIEEGKVVDVNQLREELEDFEDDLPADYKLAASEGVNSTSARQLRNRYVAQILDRVAR